VAAVFVDFTKNKCNFLHKKTTALPSVSLIASVAGSSSSHGAAPYEEFSRGAVATIAPCKSAPMPPQQRGRREAALHGSSTGTNERTNVRTPFKLCSLTTDQPTVRRQKPPHTESTLQPQQTTVCTLHEHDTSVYTHGSLGSLEVDRSTSKTATKRSQSDTKTTFP